MRKHYDLKNGRPNPYARRLKRSITIRVDPDALEYFQNTAEKMHIPYQTLINMYLRDCAEAHRKPLLKWG